ncbi:MAG: WD40 repeat domain-containing protein, partial [Planctomycetota bacterium]
NIWALAVSQDGKRIAAGDERGVVVVYDLAESRVVQTIPKAHPGELRSLCFSNDGMLFSAARSERRARAWRLGRPVTFTPLARHSGVTTCVAVSSSADRVATGCAKGEVRISIIDGNTVKQRRRLLQHPAALCSVQFHPDGQRLVTTSRDQMLRIWSLRSAIVEHAVEVLSDPAGSLRHPWPVDISRDGRRIVNGCLSGDIHIRDGDDASLLSGIRSGQGRLHSVRFSPDGQRVVSGGVDGSIKVWSVASGSEVAHFRGHPKPVHQVHWLGNDRLVSGSTDGSVKIWSLGSSSGPAVRFVIGDELGRLSASEKGAACVAAAGRSRTIVVWDIEGQRERSSYVADGQVVAVAASTDGDRVAASVTRQGVQILNAASGQVEKRLATGAVWGLAFQSENSDVVATAGQDRSIRLWSVPDEAEIAKIGEHANAARAVVFSGDGTWLASSSSDGDPRLWNVERREFTRRFEAPPFAIWQLAFSPDAEVLAAAQANRVISVWNVESGEIVSTLLGHGAQVISVDFSPDGTRLLSGSQDRFPRLWDWRRGELVLVLDDVKGWCRGVAFSPDGRRIFATSSDGGLREWSYPPNP